METIRADIDCKPTMFSTATIIDQIAPVRPSRTRRKPHPALVVAWLVLAVGLWFVICAVSGRIVWFW